MSVDYNSSRILVNIPVVVISRDAFVGLASVSVSGTPVNSDRRNVRSDTAHERWLKSTGTFVQDLRQLRGLWIPIGGGTLMAI